MDENGFLLFFVVVFVFVYGSIQYTIFKCFMLYILCLHACVCFMFGLRKCGKKSRVKKIAFIFSITYMRPKPPKQSLWTCLNSFRMKSCACMIMSAKTVWNEVSCLTLSSSWMRGKTSSHEISFRRAYKWYLHWTGIVYGTVAIVWQIYLWFFATNCG